MSSLTSRTLRPSGIFARLRTQRGFSMFEIIMSMGFAAILVVLAVPRVNDFWTQYRLMGASNQLALEISLARMQATAQNRFARVRVQSAQYVRETSTNGTDWTAQATTTLPNGVTASAAEVRFDKGGYATINNSITVTNTLAKTKTLATSILGRVTVT
jgi:Tfp pilus assembly protein FimT